MRFGHRLRFYLLRLGEKSQKWCQEQTTAYDPPEPILPAALSEGMRSLVL
jgi:hypothetical protein